MDSYNLSEAFKRIENELLLSIHRNLERHRAEETKEGYNWDMWQVKQLKALDEYKKRNIKEYSKTFSNLNEEIKKVIKKAYRKGGLREEIRILGAIKKGVKKYSKSDNNFFKINDKKLNALIDATTKDVKKAQFAVLRLANDKYRQIIYNAQVYANTGAGTYEKAVDMATRDFLFSGLRCVEYKNGARHTLYNYSKMAIKTASKRAYLKGEGDKRKEWGIYTVILNKRTNACPLCLPFVGKVLIDDVWSGGSKKDNDKYFLMSEAIKKGLYHPNCKDSHTTYFEELDENKEVRYSKKELEEILEKNRIENELNYASNQSEKYKRLYFYSLDKDNKSQYKAKFEKWEEKKGELKDEKEKLLLKDLKDESVNSKIEYKEADKNKTSYGIKTLENYNIYSENWSKENRKAILDKDKEKLLISNIQNIINDNEFSTRFHARDIEKILESGRFKNQFETATSGGTVNKKYRKEATKKLFGADIKKLKPKDYEKYGYLAPIDFIDDYRFGFEYSSLNQYGDVICRFDKNKLFDRVTYTINDSLGPACKNGIIADSVKKATLNSIETKHVTSLVKIIEDEGKLNLENLLKNNYDIRYIELQYHGDLTLTDIKEICFTKDVPVKETIDSFKNLGIKIFRMEGNKVVKM